MCPWTGLQMDNEDAPSQLEKQLFAIAEMKLCGQHIYDTKRVSSRIISTRLIQVMKPFLCHVVKYQQMQR